MTLLHILYDEDHKHSIFCAENQKRVEKVLDFIIKSVKRHKDYIKLLDAGCGTGNILRLTENKVGLLAGVDVSAECLKSSSRYTKSLICSDCSCLPFKGGSVDIITAYSVLHHLYDFKKFLREAYRILENGGWIYTDFDHNNLVLHKIIARYKEKMFQLPLLNSLKKTIKGNAVNSYKVIDYKLANYHNEFKGGINFQEVRAELKEIGFRNIDIFYYKKQDGIYYVEKGISSMLRCPFAYCVAEK